MIVITILTILCSLLFGLYLVSISKFDYWKKKKVPFVKPVPIFGNFAPYILFRRYYGHVAQDLCDKMPNEPYFGTFFGTEPALMIQDPEMIKTVLTKDFYYFSGRQVSNYTDKELITKDIFFSGGDRWKVIRQNLTPIFSSAKMKKMFYLIENCSHELENMLDKEVAIGNHQVEAKFLMTRFTMGCIGSCAFGINTNTMEEMGKGNFFNRVLESVNDISYTQFIKIYMRAIWPAIFYGAGFKTFALDIHKPFHDLLTGVFKDRGYKPSNRHDLVDSVLGFVENKQIVGDCLSNMKTGENKKSHLEVNDELLVAQCLSMFIAGFETSATTLSFTLYELAKSQEAQKLAQAEIDSFLKRHGNKLVYECVTELPYLEACVDEALRLYPVLAFITREVVEDYTFPSGLSLDKKVRVHIPILQLHKNPDYFPEPEVYRPERFLPENKKNIKPYTYIPFGEGQRICIGMRFAKMQMFAGLVTLLKKYQFELSDDMPTEVNIHPRCFIVQSVGGIRLKCTPREGWEDRVYVKND